MTLIMVMGLSLLVYSLAERQLRKELLEQKKRYRIRKVKRGRK